MDGDGRKPPKLTVRKNFGFYSIGSCQRAICRGANLM